MGLHKMMKALTKKEVLIETLGAKNTDESKGFCAVHIPRRQSTPNRSRCAPKPRRLRTAAAIIVHLKHTHK